MGTTLHDTQAQQAASKIPLPAYQSFITFLKAQEMLIMEYWTEMDRTPSLPAQILRWV